MKKNKIVHDPELSKQIFKTNLSSLISLSRDNINTITNSNKELFKEISEWDYSEHPVPDNYFDGRSAELAHLDWLLLNSIFISSFAYFEFHLHSLTSVINDRVVSRIKPDDIQGDSTIGDYRKYLDLVGQIETAKADNVIWATLGQFRTIRNRLVHGGGVLRANLQKPLEKQSGYQLLEKYGVLMAGSLGLIRIRKLDIIEAFAGLTFELSDKLVNEIYEKYPD